MVSRILKGLYCTRSLEDLFNGVVTISGLLGGVTKFGSGSISGVGAESSTTGPGASFDTCEGGTATVGVASSCNE